MRALTEAEGRVIAVLLGARATSERERLQRLDVPRSTYHAARRRAYAEGWLRDRYVPDPLRFGFHVVTIAVVRPYADRAAALAAAWAAAPTNVVTWLGSQVALGVFYHHDAREAERFDAELAASKMTSGGTTLATVTTEPELPVFFDYEGLWAHLAGLTGTLSYPSGLGGGAAEDDADGVAHRRRSWAALELVHRPFTAEASGRAGHLVGPLGLPFSQLKLLRTGAVGHRVFLDPSRVPPYQGRSADQVVLLVGDLRDGARPEQVFATLTKECRVFPFLYATHDRRLLLGALGRGATSSAGAATPTESGRRPVLATLQEFLEGIEVVQEPSAAFQTVVDHRYDRLLPKPAA